MTKLQYVRVEATHVVGSMACPMAPERQLIGCMLNSSSSCLLRQVYLTRQVFLALNGIP